MKKLNLSLVAFLAMSTLVMAVGDIAPVEASTSPFYVGLVL